VRGVDRGVVEATGVTEALNFTLALFIIELPPAYSPMTFAKWLSLSEEEREAEKRSWYPFEPGYWHSLAVEAVARFSAEFGSRPHVIRVFKSLYHARELIVAVQTDLSPAKEVDLPLSYLGFRVLQFANQIPEGVLVDPGPPSKSSSRTKGASRARGSRVSPPRTHGAAAHYILPLEGEIDLHVSPRIATELRALIEDKPEKLVIDLSKVSYIDSSGLAVLIDGMQKVEAYRGKLYLVGMQKAVRIIFEMSRLDQVFRIRRNVADALAVS
jgi:anti-sigma B factor antagonist